MNHRMRYLAAGVLSLLFLGLIYSWSNFSSAIGQEFGWDRESMRLVFTLSIITFCFGGFFGAKLNERLSFRATLLVAAALLAGGFAGTAAAVDAGGLPVLYGGYGILCGTGCGIAYNTIIATVNAWFPDRVGFSSGALMMGFGIGGLVLGTAAAACIEVTGWRVVFMGLALLVALVLLATTVIVKPRTKEEDAVAADGVRRREAPSMARSPLFWVYCLWATCAICAGLMIIGDAKSSGLAVGLEAGFATLLVGLVSTTNGAAQVIDHGALLCAEASCVVFIFGNASRQHGIELEQRYFPVRVKFSVIAGDDAVFCCPANVVIICMVGRHIRKQQCVRRQCSRSQPDKKHSNHHRGYNGCDPPLFLCISSHILPLNFFY